MESFMSRTENATARNRTQATLNELLIQQTRCRKLYRFASMGEQIPAQSTTELLNEGKSSSEVLHELSDKSVCTLKKSLLLYT
jgi:hypothetical protein